MNSSFDVDNVAPQLESAEHSDVKAELDSLWNSWQLPTPHSPNSEPVDESSLISTLITTIAEMESLTQTQQLLQEINSTRDRLLAAQADFQVLYQRHQDRFDAVDTSILQAKQLKFRTQQLAQLSKDRVEKVQGMLSSIAQIHGEIIANLNKFGGYAEIRAMLMQLETTRHTLVIAHDRATTGQEAFYDSLHAIQQQVAARSEDSEQKLRQYHESIQSLSQTISTDRLQIAAMSVDLSAKLTDLYGLTAEITTIHAQVVETSQTLQTRIAHIERGFVELSESVQAEKEQFYALTVESIEKTDAVRSQLIEIIKQINDDRDSIATLKAELALVRQSIEHDAQQQLINSDVRDRELVSVCNNLQSRQKNQSITARNFTRWLWILSIGVGGIFLMLLWILRGLK